VDLKFLDRFTVHADFHKTVFGRALLGDPATLRKSEEYRLTAMLGWNFGEDLGLRLSGVTGRSARYEGDDGEKLNAYAYNGIGLCFFGKWLGRAALWGRSRIAPRSARLLMQ
jgi:hypothetical protein